MVDWLTVPSPHLNTAAIDCILTPSLPQWWSDGEGWRALIIIHINYACDLITLLVSNDGSYYASVRLHLIGKTLVWNVMFSRYNLLLTILFQLIKIRRNVKSKLELILMENWVTVYIMRDDRKRSNDITVNDVKALMHHSGHKSVTANGETPDVLVFMAQIHQFTWQQRTPIIRNREFCILLDQHIWDSGVCQLLSLHHIWTDRRLLLICSLALQLSGS